MDMLHILREVMPVMRVRAAAAPVNPDRDAQQHAHPTRQYIDAIKRGLKRPFPVGPGVTLTYRAVAPLKGKIGEYTVKLTFQHNHNEIPDLELVLYVGTDDMVQLFQARKIRAVSKKKSYKHTAKDEAAVLSADPATVCDDIRHKFGPQGELNRVILDLYKQAIRHLADRHPENDQEIPERLSPFDYGVELRRAFGTNPVHVDAELQLVLQDVTALKADDDIVVKFQPRIPELPASADDLEFLLYLTTDKLTDGVGVRKIRFRSKKADYTDSDTQYWKSLEADPQEAAADLRNDLEGGPLGDLAREMALRARYQLAGGEKLGTEWKDSNNPGHFADPEDEAEHDIKPGPRIDWDDLGRELGIDFGDEGLDL